MTSSFRSISVAAYRLSGSAGGSQLTTLPEPAAPAVPAEPPLAVIVVDPPVLLPPLLVVPPVLLPPESLPALAVPAEPDAPAAPALPPVSPPHPAVTTAKSGINAFA